MKQLIHLSRAFFLIFFLCAATAGHGQSAQNRDMVYDNEIHSVQLSLSNDPLADPIIRLGSADKIRLAFDDFSNESFQFKYTFIHCSANWETSKLDKMEYLYGYFEDEINNYKFSLNASPPYIHYKLDFPNANMGIKLSGNYILMVYLDNTDDENIILTKRFMVVEPLATIAIDIPYYSKNLEYTRKKQQVDIRVQTPDLFNAEPMQRVNVVIQQNGRWDNAKFNLKPTSIMMNELAYEYPDGIVFDGGNQFRNFDMKSFWYQSPHIRQIINEEEGYTVVLHTDGNRSKKPYETYEDLHGRAFIKARNDQNSDIEGEYAWVEFTLHQPKIEDAEVYILGALNDWHLDEKSKMKYNARMNMYHGDLFLKQGFYNYQYVVVPNGSSVGDVTIIEGDHWDTLNEYKIYVYYRERVPNYDRLIGYSLSLSH